MLEHMELVAHVFKAVLISLALAMTGSDGKGENAMGLATAIFLIFAIPTIILLATVLLFALIKGDSYKESLDRDTTRDVPKRE